MSQPAPIVPAAEAHRQRELRKRRRRLVLRLVFVAPVLLLLWALWLAYGPKPAPPPAAFHPTPQQQQTAARDIAAIKKAFNSPPATPATPQSGENVPSDADTEAPVQHHRGPKGEDLVTLQLSEPDLNTYLTQDKKIASALKAKGVQAVQLLLQKPANVTIRARVLYQGRPANVQLLGGLTPDPKTGLRFTATKAQVGLVPIPPRLITQQADKVAAQMIGQLHGHLPIKVQSVSVVGNRLILRGTANGPAPGASAASPKSTP